MIYNSNKLELVSTIAQGNNNNVDNKWSQQENTAILNSIKINGLISAKLLQKRGGIHFSSTDSRSGSSICVNAFHFRELRDDSQKTLKYLLNNPAAGLFQIAQERYTDQTLPISTFARTIAECRSLAVERIHNTALFVLDPNYIRDNEKSVAASFFENEMAGGELNLKISIPNSAFKAALVPTALLSIFSSIFPNLQVEEVSSTTCNYLTYFANSYGFENSFNLPHYQWGFHPMFNTRTIPDCQAPDYRSALENFIARHVEMGKEEPLFFHLVRLKAPSDEQLIHLEKDKSMADIPKDVLEDLKKLLP